MAEIPSQEENIKKYGSALSKYVAHDVMTKKLRDVRKPLEGRFGAYFADSLDEANMMN